MTSPAELLGSSIPSSFRLESSSMLLSSNCILGGEARLLSAWLSASPPSILASRMG